MTPVQFGFCMPGGAGEQVSRDSFLGNLNRALKLVSGHFDAAWMVDHLMFDDDDVLEAFTTLTYLSALHPGLNFGHTVLCQSFRNPALVAKMGATLQFLNGGRFILGLGAGWHKEEYRAYGYDFPSDRVRVEQTEEALQIIKAMWTEKQATFEGKYYRITQANCEPRPSPVPPVMIGAFRPRMLRLAAKFADNWNVSSTGINSYRSMVAEFERACAEVGRDPSTVRRSWCGGCACAPTQEAAASFAGDLYSPEYDEDDFGFVGTPAQIVAQMRPFIDLGVDYFILDCGGFPNLTTLELLVGEVLPQLNA